MPRFYFHIADGLKMRDLSGIELDGLGAAQREAIEIAGRIIAEGGKSPWSGEEWTLTVTDDRQVTLFKLAFSGSLAPGGNQPVAG